MKAIIHSPERSQQRAGIIIHYNAITGYGDHSVLLVYGDNRFGRDFAHIYSELEPNLKWSKIPQNFPLNPET